MYKIIETFLKYEDHLKDIFEKEYIDKFHDYREVNEEEKNIYTDKKVGELPFHQKLGRFELRDFLMDYDGTG